METNRRVVGSREKFYPSSLLSHQQAEEQKRGEGGGNHNMNHRKGNYSSHLDCSSGRTVFRQVDANAAAAAPPQQRPKVGPSGHAFASTSGNASMKPKDQQKEWKDMIRSARKSGDSISEGRAHLRIAEMKLEKQIENQKPSSSKAQSPVDKKNHASSYALKGLILLMNAGQISEALQGIHLYARARSLETPEQSNTQGAVGLKQRRHFLNYQGSAKDSRLGQETRTSVKLFETGIRLAEQLDNQPEQNGFLEQIHERYLKSKRCKLEDFIFHDPLRDISEIDHTCIKHLKEECSFADRFVECSKRQEVDSARFRKHAAKALLWQASTAVQLARALVLLGPARATEWNNKCQLALKDVEELESESETSVTMQRLCIQSESLLLSGDSAQALANASRAIDIGLKEKNYLQCIWASVAKARVLVTLRQFKDGKEVLKSALLHADNKLDEAVKLEIYHCIERMQGKDVTSLKISALESQLNMQNSSTLTSGMKLEKIALLSEILQKEKEASNWEKALGFASTLSEITALEPNSWEFLVEVAELHFRMKTYSKASVMCSQAVAMAEANSSLLGKCNALFFRALSRMAIGEYELAEADLSSCSGSVVQASPITGRDLLRAVHSKTLNLLSLIYGGVYEKEEKALEYETLRTELCPQPVIVKRKEARKEVQIEQVQFDIPREKDHDNTLVKMYFDFCNREDAQPSQMVECALRNARLTKKRALRLSVAGGPSGQLSDSEAKVLINFILSSSMCTAYDFDGIILEMPENKLGNSTVKAICGKLRENPSNSVRLVGLDLSHNNLSAGSVSEINRCEKINSHLEMLHLRGNRRLLSSQGDIRALEELLQTAKLKTFDCVGTMLREDGLSSLLKALQGTKIQKMCIGLLKTMDRVKVMEIADCANSCKDLRDLEVVGINPEDHRLIYNAFVRNQETPHGKGLGELKTNCEKWKGRELDMGTELFASRYFYKNSELNDFKPSTAQLVPRGDQKIEPLAASKKPQNIELGNRTAACFERTSRQEKLHAQPVSLVRSSTHGTKHRYQRNFDKFNTATEETRGYEGDLPLDDLESPFTPAKGRSNRISKPKYGRSNPVQRAKEKHLPRTRSKQSVSLSWSQDSIPIIPTKEHEDGIDLSLSESDSDFLRSDNSCLSEHSDTSQERTRVQKRKLTLPFEEGKGKAKRKSYEGASDANRWRSALQILKSNAAQKTGPPVVHVEDNETTASSTVDSHTSMSDCAVNSTDHFDCSALCSPKRSAGEASKRQILDSLDDLVSVGESVSQTESDSFSPKYKTQR